MFSTLCWYDFVPLHYKESAHLAIIHLFLTKRTKNQPDSEKKEERKGKKVEISQVEKFLSALFDTDTFFSTNACFFLGKLWAFRSRKHISSSIRMGQIPLVTHRLCMKNVTYAKPKHKHMQIGHEKTSLLNLCSHTYILYVYTAHKLEYVRPQPDWCAFFLWGFVGECSVEQDHEWGVWGKPRMGAGMEA